MRKNKAHSMTQVPMTLTQGQGQRSRSNFFQKCIKNQRTGHISKAISPTDFILGTKVEPNKALGQGQRSRSNFSQNGLNTKQLATSLLLFHPQTSSYLYYHSFLWLIWALPSCLKLKIPMSPGLILHVICIVNFC